MSREEAVVIAAGVGALAALLGHWLNGLVTSRLEVRRIDLEKTKLQFGQEAALKAEARKSMQDCITLLASAAHTMCWLTWFAKMSSARITEERVKEYDDDIHSILPQLIGQTVNVGTYSNEIGKKAAIILADIEDLDARIGEAAVKFLDGDNSSIDKLKKHHQEAMNLLDTLEKGAREIDFESVIAKLA